MKVLGLLAALTVLVLPAQAATTRTARVTVPDTTPFTVHGTGFASSEQVSVSVMVNARRARMVKADAAGTFTTTFPGLKVPRCTGYTVQARGLRGDSVTRKVIPDCAPDVPPPLYPR
jgi:hypothetical protein